MKLYGKRWGIECGFRHRTPHSLASREGPISMICSVHAGCAAERFAPILANLPWFADIFGCWKMRQLEGCALVGQSRSGSTQFTYGQFLIVHICMGIMCVPVRCTAALRQIGFSACLML